LRSELEEGYIILLSTGHVVSVVKLSSKYLTMISTENM